MSVTALAEELGVDRTVLNPLWVADITYIRLKSEFVCLAVILYDFSRKVVGWKLGRTLTSRLATEPLGEAIESHTRLPGLVHHSDRGIQYASAEYVAILKKNEIVSSRRCLPSHRIEARCGSSAHGIIPVFRCSIGQLHEKTWLRFQPSLNRHLRQEYDSPGDQNQISQR